MFFCQRAKLAELYRQERLTSKAAAEYGNIASLMLGHEGGAEQALQIYQRAIDLDPADLDLVRDALTRLMEAGQPGSAERLLAAAVERNPAAEQLSSVLRGAEPQSAAPQPVAPQPVAPQPVAPQPVAPQPAAPQPAAPQPR